MGELKQLVAAAAGNRCAARARLAAPSARIAGTSDAARTGAGASPSPPLFRPVACRAPPQKPHPPPSAPPSSPQQHLAYRELESRLVELLNMKGKQRHKWDALRATLDTNIVVHDNTVTAQTRAGPRARPRHRHARP